MMYEGDANDQFIFKVAATTLEAIRLIEVGFEYNAEVEGINGVLRLDITQQEMEKSFAPKKVSEHRGEPE